MPFATKRLEPILFYAEGSAVPKILRDVGGEVWLLDKKKVAGLLII
jgi:hypothetical protein